MTIVKLNKKKYVQRMYGRGIYGKYSKVRLMNGSGIVSTIGQAATQHVLGGLGKSTGSFYGKQLGKLIGDKTGSKLLGSVAKSALSGIGSFAGNKLGDKLGQLVANKVFSHEEKKKEKKVSLSELLDQARNRITGNQSATGIIQY